VVEYSFSPDGTAFVVHGFETDGRRAVYTVDIGVADE
jgi:hypothetical protein